MKKKYNKEEDFICFVERKDFDSFGIKLKEIEFQQSHEITFFCKKYTHLPLFMVEGNDIRKCSIYLFIF